MHIYFLGYIFLNEKISKEISLFHDPEEYGSDDDRSERIESYVKDFIPLKLGVLNLKKGKGTLTLKGLKKNGKELIDFNQELYNYLGEK